MIRYWMKKRIRIFRVVPLAIRLPNRRLAAPVAEQPNQQDVPDAAVHAAARQKLRDALDAAVRAAAPVPVLPNRRAAQDAVPLALQDVRRVAGLLARQPALADVIQVASPDAKQDVKVVATEPQNVLTGIVIAHFKIMEKEQSKYAIYKPHGEWQIGSVKEITFIVTENCQLRCKYCYVVHKNSFAKLSYEVACQSVDYILTNREIFHEKSVVWDFIGGEPFLEIELIDKLCDYIKRRMYELDHPWFNAYRINITTNGVMYDDCRVQAFIHKNHSHLSLSITLDGTADKHDANRIYPNGKGSYNDVLKNIPLWISQFPVANTKSTISHEDLPYVKDSVIHLWKVGIKVVNINVVYENVWHEGDDLIFEEQLKLLADEIVDNNWFTDHYCTFFDRSIGKPLDIRYFNDNWCGAGKMLAIDCSGNFFPCLRFAGYSLNEKKELKIGNCKTGINTDLLRPFKAIDRASQSTETCINCEVASGCAWCQGGNYDNADTNTIFQRATYSCLMHKARVRANEYFWSKIEIKLGKK